MLHDDDKRYAIETCRSSESVLKKWFKINDIQLVHLLVVWWLVNLQDARCSNKNKEYSSMFVSCTTIPSKQHSSAWKFPGFASCLSDNYSIQLKYVRWTDGMTVNGKNRSTRTKTSSHSTFSPPIFPISDQGPISAFSVGRVRLLKTQFVPHREHGLFPLQRMLYGCYVEICSTLISRNVCNS